MPEPISQSFNLPRAAVFALAAAAALLASACVSVPRGPGGTPYTARLPMEMQSSSAPAPLSAEERKKLDELNAKALRESDQAVQRDAEARAYAATPYYAPYPYYGSYSMYYGSGWRHHGGWGFSYGAPIWGYPYYW
jgi:surface antigen